MPPFREYYEDLEDGALDDATKIAYDGDGIDASNVADALSELAAGKADSADLDVKVDKSTLTTNDDILTRAAGVPARITRDALATDLAGRDGFTAQFLPKTGGTISGDLTVQGESTMVGQVSLGVDPVYPYHAAHKQYVDDTVAAGGGGGVTLEQVQDDLGNTSLVAGAGITKTYNDAAGTITIGVTASTYQPLDSDLTAIAAANNGAVLAATTASFLTAQNTKLNAIDADIATFSLPASTTISAFGATLVDDADAATARTTLGLGTAATTAVLPQTGRYYFGSDLNMGTGPVTTEIMLSPITFPIDVTINRISMQITVAVGASTIRLGIYNSHTNGLPGTVLLDAGTIATASTGLKEITVSQALIGGRTYWLGYTASTTGISGYAVASPIAGYTLGRTTAAIDTNCHRAYYGFASPGTLVDLTGLLLAISGATYASPFVRIV